MYDTGAFEYLAVDVEEAEHSLEMHLPYISKVMAAKQGDFTIVPIMIGSLSKESEDSYGNDLLLFYIASAGCNRDSRSCRQITGLILLETGHCFCRLL